MMLYGVAERQPSDEGLLDMREVTIVTWPDTLRQIAQFLLDTADEMETGNISTQFHRHASFKVRGWRERFPDKDIIIAVPPDFPATPPKFVAE